MIRYEECTPEQQEKLVEYEAQLLTFNRRHNLISGGSEADIRRVHTEHSLQLAARSFPEGSVVVDWGTGGGLPLIPLAVLFPEVSFHGIDAVRKKVLSVRSIARRLNLENVEVWHGRAEEWGGRLDYSVSRATAPLATLWRWHERAFDPQVDAGAADWPHGLLCLKGGDLDEEMRAVADEVDVFVEELGPAFPTKRRLVCTRR